MLDFSLLNLAYDGVWPVLSLSDWSVYGQSANFIDQLARAHAEEELWTFYSVWEFEPSTSRLDIEHTNY